MAEGNARRRVGICVVGLGEMGQIHARNLARVPGVDVYVAAKRPGVAKAVAAGIFAAGYFESYDAAYAHPNISAVVIATQPADHPAQITQAALSGKHIFCEKPLGYSTAEIKSALAQVQKAGVLLVSGFMRRFDPGYAAAHRTAQSGELGHSVILKCTSGDAEYPEKYQRDLGFNSMLLDLGVHDIDLARWLLNSEVKRVYACCDALVYPRLKELGDSDTALLTLEMASGAKAMVHLSRALGYGYNVTSQLVGAKGSLDIGEVKHTPIAKLSSGCAATDICPEFPQRFAEAFRVEMAAFAEFVRDGTEHPGLAFGSDGLEATRVAEALVSSWKSGGPVDV
eukprot:Plantae.Rhodophyta-Rhodochaete_pulchella.ctg20666.p1 GENE.Plantae.Rhodophyta-Rhodochaete_pulchella.ctg20666~~Plantae.Rhodophyta-Rhodochaete_pulchella.ctg20666.p1  ORF type:complete len:362 (+),score=48.10 Plantae.Rhodophyta-Rhodochaete_pulchella.ctg20666:69-1088(+)